MGNAATTLDTTHTGTQYYSKINEKKTSVNAKAKPFTIDSLLL